jgi:hypothetical protein
MPETKTIAVNGRYYSVTLERFDHYTEPGGPSYHGYYVNVAGHGLTLIAGKYDYKNEMSINPESRKPIQMPSRSSETSRVRCSGSTGCRC